MSECYNVTVTVTVTVKDILLTFGYRSCPHLYLLSLEEEKEVTFEK